MKRTYIVFKNKKERNKAIDFLLNTKINFLSNICKEDNKPCYLSFSPRTFVKECIDIYLNGLFYNSFSKL